MNLALYREFRPTTFEQVIGQKHITKTLANQVKTNNITHAYLFTGARGTGKTFYVMEKVTTGIGKVFEKLSEVFESLGEEENK